MRAFTWLALSLLVAHVFCLECPNTKLEFFSKFSLGRQDQLNRTFTAISKNLTIPEVFYNFSDTARYRVGDYKITYMYLDSNQKANTTGKDTVIVWGGHLRVEVDFKWNLTGTTAKNGTGIATAFSDTIQFVKNILVNNQTGYVMWNLVDHMKVSFNESSFRLSRFNPQNQEDENAVTKMMNHLVNGTGFKDHLVEGINTVMDFYLNASLHEEHFQEEKYTNYVFRHPTKGNITVTYEQILDKVSIESNGLHILSSEVIKDYADHTCGKQVPNEPMDIATYGGLQTLLSLGFIESNGKWALANGVFDTDLNRENWESWHFQFYAGDLYDVIPGLQKKFYPGQELNGNCKALQNGFSLIRGSIDTMNVTLKYNCTLNAVQAGKILDFSVDGLFVVRGHPQQRHLDFVVNHTELNATYYQTGDYAVVNKQLADYYLHSTSWALWNTKVFGSNFSIISRDYPHFEISKQGFVIIYDSSHIGEEAQSEETS